MYQETNAEYQIVDGQIVWYEFVPGGITGRLYQLAVVCCSNHPHLHPKSFILDPKIFHSKHKYLDGSLCLAKVCEVSKKTTALVTRNWSVLWILSHEIYEKTGEWITPEH